VLAVLALLDYIQIWHVYVLMFIRALGGTFHWSAMRASTSLMVPKSQLSRIAGMNQTLQGLMSIVTPPLGALLMEVLPLHTIMGIDVLTAAFAIVPLFFIAIPQPDKPELQEQVSQPVRALLRDVREGLVYLWKWKGMVLMLVIAALLNGFVNPGFSLMPVLVKNYFGGGALELGWTESAWGFGMIAGGITLSVWGGFKRKIKTALLGLIGMGIGLTVLSLTPSSLFWLALVSLFVGGYFNPITNGPFFAILQDVVDPSIQGRVFTVIGSVSGAAAPIGMLFAGPVADMWGVQMWFLVGGIITLLCAFVIRVTPSMMHLEDHRYTVTE
jgi:DHA3 family macrolide efflux protein-like MFS transporter